MNENKTSAYIPRLVEKRVAEILNKKSAIYVVGARQTGKTRLVKEYENKGYTYITLDDSNHRRHAKYNAEKFIKNLSGEGNVIIDEINRAPDLLYEIKKNIDSKHVDSKYLLTGSVNIADNQKIKQRMPGKVRMVELLPFSQSELALKNSTFIETLFANSFNPQTNSEFTTEIVHEKILSGGFYDLINEEDKFGWADDLTNSLVENDSFDVDNVAVPKNLKEIMLKYTHLTANFKNINSIANELELDARTIKKYFDIISKLFIIHELNPFEYLTPDPNLRKSIKVHFCDTGMLCALRDIFDLDELKKVNPTYYGYIFETFVFNELIKLCSEFIGIKYNYFRNRFDNEVDIVLRYKEKFVGVEVKSSKFVSQGDFRGINKIKEIVGDDKFACGVVIYNGDYTNIFGEKLWAIPVHLLWELDNDFYKNRFKD